MKTMMVALLLWAHAADAAERCGKEGVSLEVLGTEHPSYVVWVDKVSLYLIDTGPGALANFVAAGGAIETLEAVFVGTHADAQAADLPALLTTAGASARKDELPVLGPKGTAARVATFFNAKKFDHLNSATPFPLAARDVKDTKKAIRTIFTSKLAEVDALTLSDGKEPALAYRVRTHGKSLVIFGFGDGAGDALIELAKGADILVFGHVPGARAGEIATAAKVKRLVMPHLAASERKASLYKGSVIFSADRECLR